MITPTVNRVRAEVIIIFAVGILFLVLGVYGVYYLFTVELPSGHFSKLPFAAVGCLFFGLLIIKLTYKIFIPLKETKPVGSVVCPFCGALVEEDAEVCEKCKHQIDT
jgi:hypothetical protein